MIEQDHTTPTSEIPEDHDFIDVVDASDTHHYIDHHGKEHTLDTVMYPYTLYFITDDQRSMMREIHYSEDDVKREWLGYTQPQMAFGQFVERNYQKELHDFIAQKFRNTQDRE